MTPSFPRLRTVLASALALCATALLAACDYPEQGFFLLSGMDESGQVVSRTVFEIEELVDDTDLTYGFTIHVYDPATRRVIDLPFDNAPEVTRRGWLFAISDADFGKGDLALDFTHDEQLSFVGAWRGSRPRPWPLAGKVEAGGEDGPSAIEFDLPLPDEQATVQWKATKLTEAEVVKLLGAKPKTFKHVAGTPPDSLDPEVGRIALGGPALPLPEEQQPKARPKPRQPPLGGKGQP